MSERKKKKKQIVAQGCVAKDLHMQFQAFVTIKD